MGVSQPFHLGTSRPAFDSAVRAWLTRAGVFLGIEGMAMLEPVVLCRATALVAVSALFAVAFQKRKWGLDVT